MYRTACTLADVSSEGIKMPERPCDANKTRKGRLLAYRQSRESGLEAGPQRSEGNNAEASGVDVGMSRPLAALLAVAALPEQFIPPQIKISTFNCWRTFARRGCFPS